MKLKLSIISILTIIFSASSAFAEDTKPLSMEECISIALKKHPTLKAAEKDSQVATAQYKETRSAYYPQVSLNASYTQSESKSLSFITGNTETNSASINLNQNIYDFGRTGGSVEAAQARIEAKNSDQGKTKQDVVYGVKGAYLNILKAKEVIKAQDETVRQASEHLKQAQAFLKVGTKTRFDVTKAEVDFNVANLNRIKSENDLNTAFAVLRNSMGVDYSYSFDVEGTPGKMLNEIKLEQGIKEAMANRPDLQSIDASIRSQESGLKSVKGDYYPSLSLSASYGYYDQTLVGQENPLFQDQNERWSVGASLTVPIFQGYITNSKVTESLASIESLKAQKEVSVNNIVLEISQAYLSFRNAETRVGVAEGNLKTAKDSLDLSEGRYKAGVGSIIEVTDAQTSYTSAKIDLINAEFDRDIAVVAYEKAIGLYK